MADSVAVRREIEERNRGFVAAFNHRARLAEPMRPDGMFGSSKPP